ncbi:probable membrane-associated kinase regulator 6 [Aristolochia californica]|uniref:probable membrane-associated kinase regulator 6 n=1 Tax=Aristolochia californica TaxID=171875 RepID=UPI0035D69563
MQAMDGLQQLANESFSYSWLVNLKPSLHPLEGSLRPSLDSFDEASYIEMDPRLMSFKRSSMDAQDFNFTLPNSHQPLPLVHADQIFSNGLLLPLHLPQPSDGPVVQGGPPHLDSGPITASEFSYKLAVSRARARYPLLRRWQRCSKRIVRKYLGFLRPPCRRLMGKRMKQGGKVEPTSHSCVHQSCATTPRTSSAFSAADLSHHNVLFDADLESSIYEAVLHCKKSIEKKEHGSRTMTPDNLRGRSACEDRQGEDDGDGA